MDDPELSSELVERLTRIFEQFANPEKCMDIVAVEKWLTAINGVVGRGDEYREAARQMGWKEPEPNMSPDQVKAIITLPQNGLLTLDGFLAVYKKELRRGKFWGIHHDLAVLGEALPDVGMFTARYDRMYCSSALRPTAVLDTLCEKACPNDVEPSDHLPVAASFTLS